MKNKEISNKVIETRDEEKSQKTREKTNLERYGTNNTFKVDKFKDKIKNTNIEKYGTENVMQNNNIKTKQRITFFDNTKQTSSFNLPGVIEKLKKQKKTQRNLV